MGDIADWHVQRMTEGSTSSGHHSQRFTQVLDTRALLHRFNDGAIKQTARQMYNEGLRAAPEYESMTLDIMNRTGSLSNNQKNALITFIMYAN